MKKYIFILTGGFLGAISRYGLKEINIFNYKGNFPLNTWIINIFGSFVFAVIITAGKKAKKFDENLCIGITSGFLGAFTTFSSFTRETMELINHNRLISASVYCLLSIFAGLGAFGLGVKLSEKFIRGTI